MEALGALALLCALAVLAARWGVDSRASLTSKEQELAALGLTWGPAAPARTRSVGMRAPLDRLLRRDRPSEGVLALQAWNDLLALEHVAGRLDDYRQEVERERLARSAAACGYSLRSRLAVLLMALADRLDPEASRTGHGGRAPGLVGGSSEGCSQCLG